MPQSLARQNTWLLATAFTLIQLLTLTLFIALVMLPMARRSANDLAGLMVLSAQAWAELPPQTRATFEVELLTRHTLALRGVVPQTAHDEWHPPFFYLLEDALAQRIGTRQHLTHEKIDEIIWYWANVPTDQGLLGVIYSQRAPPY